MQRFDQEIPSHAPPDNHQDGVDRVAEMTAKRPIFYDSPTHAENTRSQEFMQRMTISSPRVSQAKSEKTHKRGNLSFVKYLFFVAFDIIFLNLSFYLAYYIRYSLFKGHAFISGAPFTSEALPGLRLFQIAFILVMIILFNLRGLYRLRLTRTLGKQLRILVSSGITGFAIYSMYQFVFAPTHYVMLDNTRAVVAITWGLGIIVPFTARFLLAGVRSFAYRLGIGQLRVLVIGTGHVSKLVMQHLAAVPQYGFRIVGYVGEGLNFPDEFGRFKALGSIDDLEFVLRDHDINEAVITLPSNHQGQINRCMRICQRNGIWVRFVPDIQEFNLNRMEIEDIDGLPLFRIQPIAAETWQRAIKRLFDITVASLVLLVGSPLWVTIMALIKITSNGPAIYHHTRIGQDGKPFITYKFRSMYLDADRRKADLQRHNASGRGLFKLKNDPRVTPIGRLIRRTSLDEIPQLWNIVRGDMSLIGPRPPLPEEYARYEEWEKRRLEMQPGLTGLWQVRGRSDITFEEMVLMDIFYIENWSIALDAKILLKTIPAVLFSRGAY